MPEQHYNWRRFWCPRETEFRFDSRGYLLDPDTEWGELGNASVRSLDSLLDFPCLILLGEPGIGKSTSITEAAFLTRSRIDDGDDEIVEVNLRDYGSEERLIREVFQSEKMSRWRSRAHNLHLFLDSLDEGLLQINVLASLLPNLFRSMPLDRLRVRIACRTAVWPKFMEDELRTIWLPNVGTVDSPLPVYELLPLRRVDVAAALELEGLPVEDSLTRIEDVNIVPIAIKPTTLRFLILTAKREHQLPISKLQAYELGTACLCEEHNQYRRIGASIRKLGAESLRMIGARIAYATTLGNRAAIWTGPDNADVPAEDVLIGNLAGGNETIRNSSVSVMEAELREAIDTGLFSSRGSQRIGWAHPTYAEFLAAWYIVQRDLSLPQLRQLFVHPEDSEGRLIPQLQETAAWLASMSEPFLREMLEREPESLLAADTSVFSDAVRSRIAEALIIRIVQGKARDMGWLLSKRYRSIRHDGLDQQLRRYLLIGEGDRFAQSSLIQVALECNVNSLQDVLLTIALDEAREPSVRKSALSAIASIGDQNTRSELRLLAKGQSPADPDDEFKGLALRALWPDCIASEELFDELTMPRKSNFFGAYWHFFMYDLVEHLQPEHVPSALRWIHRNYPHDRVQISVAETMNRIIRFAWEHLDSSGVSDAFFEVAAKYAEHHENLLVGTGRDSNENPFTKYPERTKGLVRALVTTATRESSNVLDYCVYDASGMLDEKDIPWIIREYESTTDPDQRERWADMINGLISGQDLPCEELLDACRRDPSLREKLVRIIGPIELNSPLARRMKSSYLKLKERQSRQSGAPSLAPEVQLDVSLRQLEGGNLSGWCNVVYCLNQRPTSSVSGQGSRDSDLDMWVVLPIELRSRVLRGAERFLSEYHPRDSEPDRPNSFTRGDIDGIYALILLIEEAPERLDTLPSSFWGEWASLVVRIPLPSDVRHYEGGLKVVAEFYRRVSDLVITNLARHLERCRGDDHIYWLDRFTFCWDEDLLAPLVARISDESLSLGAFRALVNSVVEYGELDSVASAQSILGRRLGDSIGDPRRAVVAAALVTHAAESTWNEVWDLLRSNEPFAECFLAEYVTSQRLDLPRDLATKLTENEIADLYIWLTSRYPYEDDPAWDDNTALGVRERIRRWRDSLITHLKERGTRESCLALRRIASRFPHHDWLRRTILDAEETFRMRSWTPPAVSQLLSLAHNTQARIVQSEKHLLDVVLESLARLQGRLQGELPAVRDLWNTQAGKQTNWPVDENEFSDYVARFLRDDLSGRHVIINREVQIRRRQFTDIHVDAFLTPSSLIGPQTVKVIVESKCSWSRDLNIGLKNQLVEVYLADNECRHGVYLVGWFASDTWDPNDRRSKVSLGRSHEEAETTLLGQADEVSVEGLLVRSFILDCSL